MAQREDLKGLAEWDEIRECWTPIPGKQDEAAAKLGPTWVFDTYYGGFFGQDPPKPAPAPPADYCGCYMCQGGGTCNGAMCSVEAQTDGTQWRRVQLEVPPRLDAWYGDGGTYAYSEQMTDETGNTWVRHWFDYHGERRESILYRPNRASNARLGQKYAVPAGRVRNVSFSTSIPEGPVVLGVIGEDGLVHRVRLWDLVTVGEDGQLRVAESKKVAAPEKLFEGTVRNVEVNGQARPTVSEKMLALNLACGDLRMATRRYEDSPDGEACRGFWRAVEAVEAGIAAIRRWGQP